MLMAQSSSQAPASMSLIYKGEVAEDSSFALKVLTAVDENVIEPLSLQLEYKLYGSQNISVTDELPVCQGPKIYDD